MPAADLELDVVILGGGVAGLWTLRRLLSRGFAAMLVERHALGAGQTIASQGIIHGGLKYTLGGAGGRGASAAGAIADMPGRWRACLAGGGGGDPDLSGVEVLSSCQHLFTAPGFAARIAGAAASRVIRTEVARVSREHRPAALLGAPSSCDVYLVGEPVLEPRSLVGELAEGAMAAGGRLLAGSADAIEPLGEDGAVIHIRTTGADVVSVRASCVLLAAGEGNAELLAMLSAASPRPYATMQRRPLHMVMLRSAGLPPLHAHCVGPSSRPLLTVTSQSDHAERTVWYMGGELAEQGVGRDRVDQIKVARSELARLLPWIDLNEAQFATLRIDRAEGRDEAGKRPDLPVLIPATEGSRVLAAWPTKLAFAPLLADMVERSLQGMGVQPRGARVELPAFDAPPVAALPWDREDAVWS